MRHDIEFRSLSDYIDGRLSGTEKARVETHLAQCDPCRKTVRLMQNLNVVVKNLAGAAVPPAFDREFERKLSEAVRSKADERLGRVFGMAAGRIRQALATQRHAFAGAAVALLLVVSMYGILKYGLPEEPCITLVRGDVSVYSARSMKWLTAAKEMRLAKGDLVNVGRGAMADISHPGKYTVRLKDSSEIMVARLLPRYVSGTAAYRVVKGKAFVAITKRFRGSKFIINTPDAVATALGTEFLVDVPVQAASVSKFSVLEGRIKVQSAYVPAKGTGPKQVIVGGGEMTEVYKGKAPLTPRQLLDKEWREMVEFYRIGDRPQVALLVSTGKYRTRELLRPCPIYIFDVKPRTVGRSLEATIRIIDEAIKTGDRAKHLVGISRLEAVLTKYPNPNYEPQLLLFIGAYYNYLNMPQEAVRVFGKVADKYPRSTFASMALCAAGMISDEKLKDREKAYYYYNLVRSRYPRSPEVTLLKELGRK